MLVSHETPMCLLENSIRFNDYDYALVHHFEKYPEYFKFYQERVKEGRMVILDNSLYELGEAFDTDKYFDWIMKLRPTYYIIPDKFFDSEVSCKMADEWMRTYGGDLRSLGFKSIGVAQGKTYSDIRHSYNELHDLDCDMIAFTFKFHEDMIQSDELYYDSDKLREYISSSSPTLRDAILRILLLNALEDYCVIDWHKPHHLLGLQNLWGLEELAKKSYIHSIDTSYPVTCGYEGRDMSTLDDKPLTLINDIFDCDISSLEIRDRIIRNIREFKNIIHLGRD